MSIDLNRWTIEKELSFQRAKKEREELLKPAIEKLVNSLEISAYLAEDILLNRANELIDILSPFKR